MLPLRPFLFVICVLASQNALAQGAGEFSEPTPEEIDAAFNAEDAAREAAGWNAAPPTAVATDTLASLVAAADTVLRGRVTGQSVVYDEQDVPFTLTTLSVDQLLKGDTGIAEITLGQEGGPARNDDDLFLMVSTSKHFYPGEEELLFLKHGIGDQRYQGDLVIQQRFRIYEGRVYDEDGHGIFLQPAADSKGQKLGRSADRHPHARFREIYIGDQILQKYASDAGGRGDPLSHSIADGISTGKGGGFNNSISVAEFSAAIAQRVRAGR